MFYKIFTKIFTFFLIFILTPVFGVFAIEKNIKWVNIVANGDQNVAYRRLKFFDNFFDSKFFNFDFKNLKINIDSSLKEPRAQIKWREINISATILNDWEFFKLFIHELGHFLDLYILRASKNQADPSNDFYKISWQSTLVKHPNSSILDFVSGYAVSNKYEDFAESFVYYIFHNDNFYEKAMKNDILRQKYLFFADYVFVKWEFQWTSFSTVSEPNYLWDTTRISINLQNFLLFLKTSIYYWHDNL